MGNSPDPRMISEDGAGKRHKDPRGRSVRPKQVLPVYLESKRDRTNIKPSVERPEDEKRQGMVSEDGQESTCLSQEVKET